MEGLAPLEAPARKVHKRKPHHKELEMAASQTVRSNSRKVIDASAPKMARLGHSFPFTTQTSDQGKRLETLSLARHEGTEADDYLIRHATTGFNSIPSRRAMTGHHMNSSIDGLIDSTETAGAVDDTAKSQWKLFDPHTPFNWADSSAPVSYNSLKTNSASLSNGMAINQTGFNGASIKGGLESCVHDSVPLSNTNNGSNLQDLFNVTDFRQSRINHGYTKDPIPGAVQGILGSSNDKYGIELPNQMLRTGQTQASPIINTSVSSNERVRFPLSASKQMFSDEEPFNSPHVFKDRTRNRYCLDSSSASSVAYSSPAAQASLRQHVKSQRSYVASPNVSIPDDALSPTAHGIALLKPKERIPDRFQTVFPYDFFNAVQSKCFNSVYSTDDNMVVSAPTGSGKTVLFELAICRLAHQRGNDNTKIVYIAPTKALCREKAEQWRKKFDIITMPVSELTGDTSREEMKTVREARIIVTTPEKWDSITRSWVDHRRLLDLVELFLIDEVHILKESRGATLEAVVSRMKTYGSKVRFIAVSATVPNSADIASWLGRDHENPGVPARLQVFGEEFRPVKLQKFVHGFDAKLSDHAFDSYLNSQLWKYIEMHTQRKPILVFCMTRKSCLSAAQELAKQWNQRHPSARLWFQPRERIPVADVNLQELVQCGVAFHHAGLASDDRKVINQAFEEGHLSVICCTSTLAMGVNLPCHTVVLKGTVSYQDGGQLCEYSDLEVMQMLGRAGRPQYEDSALAIILTRSCNKKRYEDLGSGQQILESTLHKNLIEHLNSEISLGTFQDNKGAKLWLKGTFLSVRLHQNPRYYGDIIGGESSLRAKDLNSVEEQLGEICKTAITNLRDISLIKGHAKFQHTDYGRAMSKYMIRFETMKMILEIPKAATGKDLLKALCEAREFSEIRWQANERDLFRDINKDPFIVYPIEGAVNSVAHKISLLIQMELGRVDVSNISGFERQRLHAETNRVLDMMHRLIRTVIECKGSDADGPACWAALGLARSMTAKAWEDKPMQLLQIPQLGPAMMRKLVSHNIRTVSQLANSDPGDIERIASRNPPFGKKMADSLAFFPRLTLSMSVKDRKVDLDGSPMLHVDGLLGFTSARGKWQGKFPIVTFLAVTTQGTAAFFCRESLNAFNQHQNTQQIHFTWTPQSYQEALICRLACEEIVGTVVATEVRHDFPPSAFPPQIKDSRLPSDESRRSISLRTSPIYHAIEDEVEDDDLLGILNDTTCQGDSNKRNKIEADHGDDNIFAIFGDNSNDNPAPRPRQGQTIYSSTGRSDQLQNQSVPSSRTIQRKVGSKDEVQLPRPPKSKTRKGSSQICDNEPVQDEPVRLENGRYKCGHPCSQVGGGTTSRGHKCGHDCCRNGSKYPPKRHNTIGKRKQKNDQELQPDNQSLPAFSISKPTIKRSRKDNDPSRKVKASETSTSASGLDLSLCDVDEEGIIDLTCHYETASDVPHYAVPPSTIRLDKNRETLAAADTDSLDDLLGDLSDDDMDIDIDIALKPPHTRKGTQTFSQNSNRIGYSDDMSNKDRHGRSGVSTQTANRTSKKGQERVLEAMRSGKSGSTRRSQSPKESRLSMFSSDVLPSDKKMLVEDDWSKKKFTEPVVTGEKSRYIMETGFSTTADIPATQRGPFREDEPTTVTSKRDSEPEWVTSFDPAWISEFRGLVDFM